MTDITELFVGTVADFADGACRIVVVDGREVGVREHQGEYYAYENRCVHQGGPACEGVVLGRVEETVGPVGEITGHAFSATDFHFVCPWHGWEYELKTGEFVGDRRRRLRRYETVVREERVYVATT